MNSISNEYQLPPVYNPQVSARGKETPHGNGTQFADLYGAMRDPSSKEPKTLDEAGRQMEVMITTMVLKTMEESSTEGGLLGTKSQGMGYFKDIFLEQVAKDMVEKGGLGIREALVKAHEPS